MYLLGFRYVEYNLNAEPEILNALCRTCRSKAWLTVLYAADKSSMITDITH